MSISMYRILYFSELAEVLNKDISCPLALKIGMSSEKFIKTSSSFFEDMANISNDKASFDSYDIDGFFVHQPESYLLKDCFARTQYGAITIKDCVLRESTFCFPWHLYPELNVDGFQEDNISCVLPNSSPDVELSAGFSVCSGINENYYHWLILFLGRLSNESLQVWADEIHCKPTLIFPVFENELQRDCAAILSEHYNLPFLSLSKQVSIKTKNLVVSEPMRSGGLVPHPMIRESLDVLKNHYYKIGDYPEKIYISRRDTTNRKILNEPLIEEMFKNRGYEVITLAGLSLSDQINYFAHAKKIVGAHGAGLTNICFSEPGTKLLEIQMPNYLNWCYRRLAAICGLDYQHIFGVLQFGGSSIHSCTFDVDPIKVMLCFEHGF